METRIKTMEEESGRLRNNLKHTEQLTEEYKEQVQAYPTLHCVTT